MSEQVLPITGLTVASISSDVVVCGDPLRATRIAEKLDNAQLLSERREYRVYNGRYQGQPVTVCSHGVGAPGAAVAFEELIAAGARRLIRVGTCGSMQPDLDAGAIVIATAAVQNTGYGREVVPAGYPAVADLFLSVALSQTALDLRYDAQMGMVLTRDAFYNGVGGRSLPDYQQLSSANVLAVEMECAALFLVSSLRGARSGAILAVDGNVLEKLESMETYQPHRDVVDIAVERSIQVALQTLAGHPV